MSHLAIRQIIWHAKYTQCTGTGKSHEMNVHSTLLRLRTRWCTLCFLNHIDTNAHGYCQRIKPMHAEFGSKPHLHDVDESCPSRFARDRPGFVAIVVLSRQFAPSTAYVSSESSPAYGFFEWVLPSSGSGSSSGATSLIMNFAFSFMILVWFFTVILN